MKKTIASLLLGAALFPLATAAQATKSDEEVIQTLYRGSYAYWQQARNENGSYEDKLFFNGERSYVGSIANSGMGLIALTIGHKNGWEPEAEQMTLQTLRMLAGKDPKISVPQNKTNTYIHFYNTQTGEAVGDDWSPIDSAIMLSGALFAKRYFSDNKEIAALADELYRKTDLTDYIANVDKGLIYLAQNHDGSFKEYATKTYNEYMLVASIAKQQALDFGPGKNSAPVAFWDKWYATTENLPIADYDGIPMLSEGKKWFTSQFNFLFNNYLIHDYSSSEEYQAASVNAATVDYTWWREQDIDGLEEYEWGSGAGACPNGYCVDRFHFDGERQFNINMMVSPHIMAGFIPYSERAKSNLIATYRDNSINARYELQGGYEILWRYSYDSPEWRANAAEGVDFSTFLFGLAALPEHLGMEFFNKNNNYFESKPAQKL
ncbi:hypothetical protein L4D76_09690 [Photobacterium sagamiensis]|uniref:hypothetical protein n=1 Tax=Photobacterium sagamiensis TaxID=2910241 RepID=UPI003D152861